MDYLERLLRIFEKLTDEKFQELLEKPGTAKLIIAGLKEIDAVVKLFQHKSFSLKRSHIFFELIKAELSSQLIKSPHDLRAFLIQLNIETFKWVSQVMHDDFERLILTSSDYVALTEGFTAEQSVIVYQIMYSKIIVIDHSTHNYNHIVKHLGKAERIDFFRNQIDKVMDTIPSAEGFSLVMEHHHRKPRKYIYTQMSAKLSGFVKNPQDLGHALSFLTGKQLIDVLRTIPWADFMTKPSDFQVVFSFLKNREPCETICETMKDQLIGALKISFSEVLSQVGRNGCIFIGRVINNNFDHIVPSLDVFFTELSKLGKMQRQITCKKVLSLFPDKVHSVKDFLSLLSFLSSKQRLALCRDMKDRMPDLVDNAVEDLLVGLKPKERTIVYLQLKDKLWSRHDFSSSCEKWIGFLLPEQQTAIRQHLAQSALDAVSIALRSAPKGLSIFSSIEGSSGGAFKDGSRSPTPT